MLSDNFAGRLSVAIAATAPINGVSIGRRDDRETWRIDFTDNATDEQRKAALKALANFDPDAPDPASESLSMRQLRQGLRAFAGKPASFIQDTINTIPDASAKDDAQIWYEETTEVHWDHPATQTLIALAKFKPDDAAALWLKIAKEIPR